MENTKVYRQGELLFIKVNISKEVGLEKFTKPKGDNCIREGEVSGHKHEVFGTELFELTQNRFWFQNENGRSEVMQLPEGQMFLTSDNSIEIRHPEHKTLKLDKGDYVIRIQREYEEGKDRLVMD